MKKKYHVVQKPSFFGQTQTITGLIKTLCKQILGSTLEYPEFQLKNAIFFPSRLTKENIIFQT